MRKRLLATAALAAALACVACQPGAMINLPNTNNPPVTSNVGTAVLTGQIMAPAGIIAPGGGNIIAPGGGNYSVLAEEALEESPLVGAEVFLADAAGNPLPGRKSVKTDAKGNYTLPDIKADYTFLVVAKAKGADGKTFELQTIAKATGQGATANMDAATTLVAASLVDSQDGALGSFNAAKFRTAAEATKRSLKRDNLPDFSNRAEVLAKIRALSEEVAEIRTALAEIKQEIDAIKSQLADLQSQLDKARLGGGEQGEGPDDCGKFFSHLDADSNGRVTLAEWMERFPMDEGGRDNPKDIFIFVDRNADGELTSAEFVPECEKHQSQRDQDGEHQGSCEDGFRFMDQDKNGALDMAEFKRGHQPPPDQNPPPVEEIFAHMDRDGDEKISEAEFLESCERRDQPPTHHEGPPTGEDCERNFTATDANRDGIIDMREFGARFQPPPGDNMTAEQAFGHVDFNRDGKLDQHEYVTTCSGQPPQDHTTSGGSCPDQFKQYDVNRDGKVDLAELKSTYRMDPGSPTPEEVFRRWDLNADRFVDEHEFVSVQCEGGTAHHEPGMTEDPCHDEFRRLDANADGLLGPVELERTGMSPEEARAKIAEADANNDGKLDPREYCGQ